MYSVTCKLVSPCDHKYSYENAHRYAVMGKRIEKERDTERERYIYIKRERDRDRDRVRER